MLLPCRFKTMIQEFDEPFSRWSDSSKDRRSSPSRNAIMISLTAKSLLMLTVAFGQLLGGVSCCCFTRSVTQWVSRSVVEDAGGATVGHCPKCKARESSNSVACSRTNKPVQDPSWQLPGCHCAKHVQAARPENKGGKVAELSCDWHDGLPSIHHRLSSAAVLGIARGPESFGGSSLLVWYCIRRE